MDEFALIARYFAPLGAGAPADEIGIGDDGAVLDLPATERLVAVVDTLVEGVHFPAGFAADDLGYRAVAVNLSDIAAMGAVPRWATLALTLPAAEPAWLAAFSAGLRAALVPAGVRLVGGDTTRGPLSVTIQILGGVTGRPLTRAGARPGDLICVSGTLGDAAAGLALGPAAASAAATTLWQRFARPSPRLALGHALRPLASAAIDVSDGLLADLAHVAEASGCGGEIDLATLPLSAELRATREPSEARKLALGGGDDYELVCTLAPASLPEAVAAAVALHVPLTAIGRMVSGSGVISRDERGAVVEPPAHSGYRHFG